MSLLRAAYAPLITFQGKKQPFQEMGLDLLSAQISHEQEPPSIPPDQLEAAIERVINKLVSDKFENILINVIEKAVKNEIDKLKRSLLEDSTGNE